MSRTPLAVSIAFLVASTAAAFSVAAPAPSRPAQAAPPAAKSSWTWLVTLDSTSKWDDSKPPQEQAGFAEHRALIDRLVKEGTLLLGGPLLTDFESRKLGGAVWIVKAESAEAARKLVESDSFVQNGFVKVAAARAFMPTAGSLLPASSSAPPPAK